LIERLRALKLRILLTSGTVTSAAVVAKRFPPDVIHQYVPYDSPRYVTRFLDHWRPSLALFIESDLWPNLILSSAARRLPMVLINGRMSQRSFPRWRRVSNTISALLGKFEVCLAHSENDAERFSALGSRNLITTANLKLDAAIVHGPHVFNFSDVYEALDKAGGARRADSQEALVKQLGQLLADPKTRETQADASSQVVEQLGGALERTLTALEPYLMQL